MRSMRCHMRYYSTFLALHATEKSRAQAKTFCHLAIHRVPAPMLDKTLIESFEIVLEPNNTDAKAKFT